MTDRIVHQYEVEKRLAEKLRTASKEERKTLYSEVYDEFFRLVPDQSQLKRKKRSSRDENPRAEADALSATFLAAGHHLR